MGIPNFIIPNCRSNPMNLYCIQNVCSLHQAVIFSMGSLIYPIFVPHCFLEHFPFIQIDCCLDFEKNRELIVINFYPSSLSVIEVTNFIAKANFPNPTIL